MNRFKKAFSVGMSAALLATLFATTVAPAVLAAAPGTAAVGSAGSVPRAGTSAAAATFTFTEADINDWSSAGTLTVTIKDSGDFSTVTFTGTPTLVAPDSLGASVSVSGNTFTVTTTDWDPLKTEQFSVQGLKIKATAGAALGAIKTTYSGTGPFGGYFDSAPKATGTLVNTVFATNTSALVNVTSVCDFAATGGGNGLYAFAGGTAESLAGTASARIAGQQTLTIAAAANGHAAGTAVSQTLASCPAAVGVLASAGTVVDSLALTVDDGPFGVQPGLFNQDLGTFKLAERTDPMFTVGTVISATITTAGVVWSNAIDANTHGSALELANETSTLSADRKTVTWTVGTASLAGTAGYMHENGTWSVDVAANAVLGSTVDVTVTAGSLLVTPTKVTLGYINNVIAGTAATPIVYIGENDQQTGMVTLNEAAVGSFTAGGSNNTFSVSLDSGYEFFTRAPFAVVTASNLKLRDPGTLLGVTSLVGVLSDGNRTATWTIYSASTDVPAKIDIRGSNATGGVLDAGSLNGGRINVANNSPIGTVNLNIASGTATSQTDFAILPIAVRAFRSGVVVTALSQPTIPKGSADSLGGDITITETLTGQLRSGQWVCASILPRSSNFLIQDTFLKTANTNDRPVITATPGSGLVVGPVSPGCVQDNNTATNTTNSFEFMIVQQAFAPNLGKITISNIHFITVADAPTGAVLLSVYGGLNESETATNFQTIVSNATIGTPAPFMFNTTGTALGNTLTGPFTASTKISTGGYITWRFDGGAAVAGKTIQIWAYKKVGLFTNPWSAPYLLTTRVANASGVAYANITSGSVIWLSIRPVLPATATTPAVWGSWSIGRWIR
ncbi:MAG: hypothetical protein HYX54_09100 [Chloroflexi bacterium]|nr:hypothetical protein [Chloroflexota bacterium]